MLRYPLSAYEYHIISIKTSSTKPEADLNNTSQHSQRKIEPRPQAICKILVKFGRVVYHYFSRYTIKWTHTHTHTHTHRHAAGHAHYSTLHLCWLEVNRKSIKETQLLFCRQPGQPKTFPPLRGTDLLFCHADRDTRTTLLVTDYQLTEIYRHLSAGPVKYSCWRPWT